MARFLLLAAFLAAPIAAFAAGNAQGVPDWASPSVPEAPMEASNIQAPTPPVTPPIVPLDGGLSLLALAGAGYAAKRLRGRRAD